MRIELELNEVDEKRFKVLESTSKLHDSELGIIIFRLGLVEALRDLELRARACRDFRIKPSRGR
jgi:metal-sulfur cluster biosynthetic enzyme